MGAGPWENIETLHQIRNDGVGFRLWPGFFTIDMAQMVGETGRVVAVDLQEEMLEKLRHKIHETELEGRVTLHKSEQNKIGWSGKVDFALAFYVVHEIPNQEEFFEELQSILQQDGKCLIVEPPFHVSQGAFLETIRIAENLGFKSEQGPKVLFSKTVILKNNH